MSHPEIENGLLSPAYLERRAALESSTTSIDLLDVPHSTGTRALWQKNLDHDQIVQTCQASQTLIIDPDAIQFGLKDTLVRKFSYETESAIFKYRSPDETRLLYSQSPLFYTRMAANSLPNLTNFPRLRCEYFEMGEDWKFMLQYSRPKWETSENSYIISNCPKAAKDRIEQCAQSSSEHFRRPFILDAFIADVCTTHCKEEMAHAREPLIAYERYGFSLVPAELLSESFQILHRLSQTWHILHEDFIDFEERLEFLIDLCKVYSRSSNETLENTSFESLSFLLSRIRIWRRWTANYNTRTKIRIDLFFNLAIQNDSRTNLDIAKTSKSIAASTLKDSSAMTTIAALTMFFLPGTFVSAIFSMVFFNATTDSSGGYHLELMSSWWYFPAISVPLTIAVFVTWILWQRIRQKDSEAVLASDSAEAVTQKQLREWVIEKVFKHRTRSTASTDPELTSPFTHGNTTLQYHSRHHDNTNGDMPEELAYQL